MQVPEGSGRFWRLPEGFGGFWSDIQVGFHKVPHVTSKLGSGTSGVASKLGSAWFRRGMQIWRVPVWPLSWVKAPKDWVV